MSRLPRQVLWVLALALAVRIAAWVLTPEPNYDGTYCLLQVDRLARLHYDLTSFPPGYPLAVTLLRLVVRDYVLAARLVSLLAGLACIVLFERWARRTLAAPFALLAALFLALHPHFMQ